MIYFISRFFFYQIPFFATSKINFWTGKKFKTAKNAISRKKILIYLIWRVFFAWTFLNFLACCAFGCSIRKNVFKKVNFFPCSDSYDTAFSYRHQQQLSPRDISFNEVVRMTTFTFRAILAKDFFVCQECKKHSRPK